MANDGVSTGAALNAVLGASQGVEKPTVDPKVATPTPEVVEKKDDKFAAKFAALARKEKESRERENSFKEREARIAKQEAEWTEKQKSKEASDSTLLEEFKANPVAFSEKHGVSMEHMAEIITNNNNPTAEMKMRRELDKEKAEFKKWQEEINNKFTAKEQAEKDREEKQRVDAEEKAIAGFKGQIEEVVKAKPDQYELILANNATELVLDVIKAHYDATLEKSATGQGELLTIDEAAEHVEKYLEDEAKKILELKKFKQTSKPNEQDSKTAPTLSNDLSTQTSQSSGKYLSDDESKRAAAKMIRWQE